MGTLAKNRKAHFKCVAVLATPDGKVKIRDGKIDGIISHKLRGNSGFGYDPLFIVPKYKKTFAEISLKVKNRISHRYRAFSKIKKILSSIYPERSGG